jgi:hypothetical protein
VRENATIIMVRAKFLIITTPLLRLMGLDLPIQWILNELLNKKLYGY